MFPRTAIKTPLQTYSERAAEGMIKIHVVPKQGIGRIYNQFTAENDLMTIQCIDCVYLYDK